MQDAYIAIEGLQTHIKFHCFLLIHFLVSSELVHDLVEPQKLVYPPCCPLGENTTGRYVCMKSSEVKLSTHLLVYVTTVCTQCIMHISGTLCEYIIYNDIL